MSKFRVWFRCGCPSYGLAATKNLPAPGTPSGMTRTYQSPGVMPSIFSLAGMDCSTRIGLCGECGLLGELCLPEFVSANDVRAVPYDLDQPVGQGAQHWTVAVLQVPVAHGLQHNGWIGRRIVLEQDSPDHLDGLVFELHCFGFCYLCHLISQG